MLARLGVRTPTSPPPPTRRQSAWPARRVAARLAGALAVWMAVSLQAPIRSVRASSEAPHHAAPDPAVLRAILGGDEQRPPKVPAPSKVVAPAVSDPTTRPTASGPQETPAAPAAPPAPASGQQAEGPERGGSQSLGYPAGGTLRDAHELPARAPAFALLPIVRKRATQFATDEMAALVLRVAKAVEGRYPGSVLVLGNVSHRAGGKIAWSVSHQAGRDADIAFFVDDARGRALEVRSFEHFNHRGTSRASRKRRFSVARNWALVEALVTDPEVYVQRIFVSTGLRAMLLEHARQSGATREAIERAETVLVQPRDSSPHSDHFHVRIYCSLADRLEGCHDYAPYWAWVPTYAKEVRRRIAATVRELGAREPAIRVQALDRLRHLEAHESAGAVGRLLTDESTEVREAALRCLRRLTRGEVGEVLTKALARVRDPRWAAELIRALGRTGSTARAATLEKLLRDPKHALPRLRGEDAELTGIRVAAAEALARAGRKTSVAILIAELTSPSAALRLAVAAALPYLTNRDLGGRWKRGTSSRRLKRQQRKWSRWLSRNERHSWPQWIRLGFRNKGIRFRGKMLSARSVPILIRTLGRGGYLAHNARRILQEIVGAEPAQYCGTRRSCWTRWWRRHHGRFGQRRPGL